MKELGITEIEASKRSDDAILDEICSALDRKLLDEISVAVVARTVTLDGKVDSWSQRRTIAALASEVDGIRRVVNLLTVRAAAPAAMALRMSIEQALARRAMREARRLEFAIDRGRVTVSGIVGSPGERDAVVGAVVGTVGVLSVDDQLRITPSHKAER